MYEHTNIEEMSFLIELSLGGLVGLMSKQNIRDILEEEKLS
jgi:hypothetical protein